MSEKAGQKVTAREKREGSVKALMLKKAAQYKAEAEKQIPSALILGDWRNYEQLIAESKLYARCAAMHPQTRAAFIRRGFK